MTEPFQVNHMANKVLVVDDETDILELVRTVLTGKGLQVKTAATGEAGINILKEFEPDVVLLDKHMPNAEGSVVAGQMKSLEAGKKASIIMMSGDDTSNLEVDPGLFVDHLKKPFKLTDMVKCVENYLKK